MYANIVVEFFKRFQREPFFLRGIIHDTIQISRKYANAEIVK